MVSCESATILPNHKIMVKPFLIVMCGPPCSGKSTFAKSLIQASTHMIRVSRDGYRYMFKQEGAPHYSVEKVINDVMPDTIETLYNAGFSVLLDNTHCRKEVVQAIVDKYGDKFKIRVIVFIRPLWLLKYRNIKRYIATGVYIPRFVITKMWLQQVELLQELGHMPYIMSEGTAKRTFT